MLTQAVGRGLLKTPPPGSTNAFSAPAAQRQPEARKTHEQNPVERPRGSCRLALRPAEPGDSLIDELLYIILVANVGRDELHFRAKRAELGGQRPASVIPAAGNNYARAFFGESERSGASNAGESTGDEDDVIADVISPYLCVLGSMVGSFRMAMSGWLRGRHRFPGFTRGMPRCTVGRGSAPTRFITANDTGRGAPRP